MSDLLQEQRAAFVMALFAGGLATGRAAWTAQQIADHAFAIADAALGRLHGVPE